MIDISVDGLIKSFEQDKNVLDGLTFDINEGERVGILGRNGAGKTTLFRILTGEVRADSGHEYIAKGKKLGLISQIPVFPEGYSVEDVLLTAHRRIFELERSMAELSEKMAEDQSLLKDYDAAAAEYEMLGGYSAAATRNRVANGLQIDADMRKQLFTKLSGGEKTRVNLARLIIEDTDILLLDEPTNHLDLNATEWLEDYLRSFKGTVLVISHDRYFLDRTINRSIEIVDGKAEFYRGNYSFYVVERQRRFDEQLKKYEKDQAKYDQLKAAAERLHLWAFMGNDALHKRAFSMEKRMDKLSISQRPKKEKEMKAKFVSGEFSGDEVLVIDGLSKSFGEKKLFDDVQLIIEGGERIALLGDNGAGKSTLIKLVMGETEPDAGVVRRGPSVKTAYLPQTISFDHPERDLVNTMLYSEKCTPQQARDRLAAFMFRGEDVYKPVSALSGGEQSRLRLCMLMRSEVNFLILDEPTNHLDIASREWIEDAVSEYPEALLFVSHDRFFIEKFANRIWMLENGRITDFRGSYSEFREYSKKQRELSARDAVSAVATAEKKEKRQSPAKRQAALDKQLKKVERDIARAEDAVAGLEAEAERFASDYQKLMELDEEKKRIQSELDELYDRWEELSEEAANEISE